MSKGQGPLCASRTGYPPFTGQDKALAKRIMEALVLRQEVKHTSQLESNCIVMSN